MQIRFAYGIEGRVKITSESRQYQRVFEGHQGTWDVEPEEWAHLQTAHVDVFELEGKTKSVPVFELVKDEKEPAQ